MSIPAVPATCPGCEALTVELQRLREMVLDQGQDTATALRRTSDLRGWLDDITRGHNPNPAAAPPLSARERMAALGWEEVKPPVPAVSRHRGSAAGTGTNWGRS